MTNTSRLSSFTAPLNVAIIGASGGIGSALTHMLAAQDNVENVYAFSRSTITFDAPNIHHHPIDLTNETSIKTAAAALNGAPLDIIIVATGLLHDGDTMPEKSLNDLSMQQFQDIFAINTFGPALLAKHFLPLIPKDRKSVFAALSARVASIGDNNLGGWYAYRASKTALNMLLKNTAIEIGRRYKHAAIIGLHPGTVDTSLSQPFQKNVRPGKLFTPDFCAESLLNVINHATPDYSGKVYDWDNKEIPN